MFEQLKRLFVDQDNNAAPAMTLAMATAALLVEVSKSDYDQSPEEVIKVRKLLVQHFNLGEDEVEQALHSAQKHSEDSTSLYPVTRFINDNCDHQEKFQLVLSLWEVAAEDGHIDKYEDHLIRKIADLIYLPHREFIRAKLQATRDLEDKS